MLAAKIVALLLVAHPCLSDSEAEAQEDAVRRLRLRRPRPKLVDVDNPDGDLVGSPVELLQADSAEAPLSSFRSQSAGSAALDALIATAQRNPEPALEISEVVPQRQAPFQIQVQEPAQAPRQQPSRTRSRTRGGVPARRRPRPGQEEEERRRPSGPREDPVATLERYSHKNEDGSFTFGYVGADGSFREETRGADCITRGKYGYIDPDGVKREYTYTSGLPCEVGEDSEDELQSLDQNIDVEDPVDPRERFRQTQQEQLSPEQIPEAAQRQRRPIQRRPEPVAQEPANTFSNFGANQVAPERTRVPPRAPIRASPRPVLQSGPVGGALQNLLTIADEGPVNPAPAPVAAPRAPVRIATQRPAVQPASPRPASFDFDSELEGFTLNRPSLTFDRQPAPAPASAQNQFQSQLSFNPASGVFQTSLQQNVPGGAQIRLNNNAAPSGTPTTVRPSPPTTASRGTTFFAGSTTASRFPTTPSPQPPSPSTPSRVVLPAGTVKLEFEPLNIPDISQVQVKSSQPPSPPPTRPPTLAPSPTPTRLPPPTIIQTRPTTSRPAPQPTTPPTRPAPRPTTVFPATIPKAAAAPETPRQSAPVAVPATTKAALPTTVPPKPAQQTPSNTFFVFQPFNQPQAATSPFRTPVNHDAFHVRPAGAAPPPPRPPVQVPANARLPQVAQPATQQVQSRPAPQLLPQAQPRPVPQRLPVAQPVPQRLPVAQPVPQRLPVAQQPRPVAQSPQQVRPGAPQPVPSAPRLQFGFQPVSQQQGQPQGRPGQPAARPAPFTAFGGRPQQFQPRPAQPQQFRQAPQFQNQPRPAQLGVPPQNQQRPAQLGVPPQNQPRPAQLGVPPQLQAQPGAPQFAQFDSRFAPRPAGQAPGQLQLRPAQFSPGASQQFNVFNPSQQLRGA